MRLNICVKGLLTLLLVLCFCFQASAQQVRVVPIVPSTPSALITGQNPAGGVPTPSGQVPSPATYPALNNLPAQVQQQMQQLQSEQAGTPQLPQTTLPPLQQPVAQTTQPPGEANIPQQAGVPQQYAEPLSSFEEYIRSGMPAALRFDISQFGYELFRQPPSTFAPVQNVPVGPNYVIGPGDEIRISVWGSIDGQWNVTVDRDGTIFLPKVGTVGLTGLTFEQLRSTLLKEFSKYYNDFEMTVSMGQLRTILVYVVGNVKKPGAYTVSSLSTLMNALFEASGPNKNGTMRDIQLKRGGKTTVHFDLYDVLLKGDKSRDVRLMPGDVIFIPTVGPLVGIAGQVNQPAIYELSRPAQLTDLIKMAGGLKGLAFKGRFQVQRVMEHRFINAVEGDLLDIQNNPYKNIFLQDGDLLKIYGVAEQKSMMNLAGAVLMPGEYGVVPGTTKIKDVVERAGGLQPFASPQAELSRLTITPNGPVTTITSFDIKKAMQDDPLNNFSLQQYDYINVHAIPDWQLHQKVVIAGEVKFPGTYAIRKGERLSSLLERAGGYTDKAYLQMATFTRERVKNLQQTQMQQMVDRLELELMASGTGDISSSLSSDEARILSEEIRQKRAFIASLRQIRAQGRVVIILDQIDRLKNGQYDVELEETDQLNIPTNPETIQVIGAVFNQSAFFIQKNKSYSDYITLCGGYTDSADTDNVYILKTNGTAVKPSGGFAWDSDSHKWTYGNAQSMQPGDTIVVPQKLDRIAWLREVKDFTQILYQIAVTAGVLIIAF